MLKFDKNKTDEKGGADRLFCRNDRCRDMNIDVFLYENELAGRIDECDREYILSCVSELQNEAGRLKAEAERLFLSACELSDTIENEKKKYFEAVSSLVGFIKEYNETLVSDGIWSSVSSDEEKKRKLHDYYSHTARIGKYAGKLFVISRIEQAEQMKGNILQTGKMIRLCGIAKEFLGEKSEVLDIAGEIIRNTDKKTDSLLADSAVLSAICEGNEALLSRYLASLSGALDTENKGVNMNLSLARRCNSSFCESVKTGL